MDTALRPSGKNEERMTSPATKNNLAVHTSSRPTQPTPKPSGWDPFEIWRTRVLLPRLAESRTEQATVTPPKPITLVRP